MVILYRQQFLRTGFYPFLLFYAAAIRAMSVCAAMVLIFNITAIVFRAPVHVISEGRSAARSYSLQYFGNMRIFINGRQMLL